jgi:hypothetical protein
LCIHLFSSRLRILARRKQFTIRRKRDLMHGCGSFWRNSRFVSAQTSGKLSLLFFSSLHVENLVVFMYSEPVCVCVYMHTCIHAKTLNPKSLGTNSKYYVLVCAPIILGSSHFLQLKKFKLIFSTKFSSVVDYAIWSEVSHIIRAS